MCNLTTLLVPAQFVLMYALGADSSVSRTYEGNAYDIDRANMRESFA